MQMRMHLFACTERWRKAARHRDAAWVHPCGEVAKETEMNNRMLGAEKIAVSPLMLGGNVFGWTADEARSFELLDRFVERGFNFIDTADVYSRWVPGHVGGESETILGKWLKQSGKRDKVVLATKVGMDMGDGKVGLSATYIREAVEASLLRLQTDYIDLYQTHKDDAKTPLEETVKALDALVREGKVRVLGASNYDGRRLRAAIEVARNAGWQAYETLQPNYSLMERQEYEHDLAPVVAEYGLGVVPYFSLAAGFLTGKYSSVEEAKGKAREGIVSKYFNARGEAVLKALDTVAKEANVKQAAVAIAWLLSRPHVLAPIASATKLEQMDDLFAGAELELTPDQLKALSMASAPEVEEQEPAMAGAFPTGGGLDRQ